EPFATSCPGERTCPGAFELGAGVYSPKTRWRPGCKLRKPATRLARLPTIRPLAFLSLWAGHVAPWLFPRLFTDPDVERLGTQSAATIHPRRSRSLGRGRSEEGRIGSWTLPLKDLTHA